MNKKKKKKLNLLLVFVFKFDFHLYLQNNNGLPGKLVDSNSQSKRESNLLIKDSHRYFAFRAFIM